MARVAPRKANSSSSQRRSGSGHVLTRRRHSPAVDFAVAKYLRGALHIHRSAEIISLSVRAAGGEEKVRLSLSLYALGYNVNAKLPGKANCGAHHRGVASIGGDPEDQLLRNF